MTAHCPGCHCRTADDERPPQPSTSSDAHRRAVIAGALAVVDSKKRARSGKGEGAT
jgi:hypothetical protein